MARDRRREKHAKKSTKKDKRKDKKEKRGRGKRRTSSPESYSYDYTYSYSDDDSRSPTPRKRRRGRGGGRDRSRSRRGRSASRRGRSPGNRKGGKGGKGDRGGGFIQTGGPRSPSRDGSPSNTWIYNMLIDREIARRARDFVEADKLREELQSRGVEILEWERRWTHKDAMALLRQALQIASRKAETTMVTTILRIPKPMRQVRSFGAVGGESNAIVLGRPERYITPQPVQMDAIDTGRPFKGASVSEPNMEYIAEPSMTYMFCLMAAPLIFQFWFLTKFV